MKNEEIVVEQRNWGQIQPIYKVVKLVNRLEPRIGKTLTEKEVREYLNQWASNDFIKITVLPHTEDE